MSGRRSLLPREHGAYAELAFPLVTGLSLAPPRPASLALALAAVALFLAHEPLGILLGLRGDRLKNQEGGRARTRVWFISTFGVISGGIGVFLAGPLVWPSILFPLFPLLLLIPLVVLRRQKSMVGELLVVTIFAALVLPIGNASMAAQSKLVLAAAVWWGSFALGTVEVHAIKARHKDTAGSRWTRWGSPLLSGIATLSCLGLVMAGEDTYRWSALALIPSSTAVLLLTLLRVHPRRLKRVGWTLVAANTVSLVILLSAFG